VDYALSIKQPWAALLVHGRKTIEVRRWSTLRRGSILIHAARIPDSRPEGWAHVTPAMLATTKLRGGIIGEAELVGCNTYATRKAFTADKAGHLNNSSWFFAPALYGFVFTKARLVPFQRCPGALHFFEVGGPGLLPATSTGLLVSVRTVEEAAAAFDGGAAVIDVKEPAHGPLGRAADGVVARIIEHVAGRRPVSAALGELVDMRAPLAVPGLSFVKCGLARLGGRSRWQRSFLKFKELMARLPRPPTIVTVAYADWQSAHAPKWSEIADFALRQPGEVLLFDTYDKSPIGPGRRLAGLLDYVSLEDLWYLSQRAKAVGSQLALAGSLRLPQILRLIDTGPTWIAVRGAVCDANDRDGPVHVLKIRSLVELIRWKQAAATGES
jgi:uncharacterized protein (UPF0264 family)